MPTVISDAALESSRILFLAVFAYIAYKTARNNAIDKGVANALKATLLFCFGVAAFAAFSVGEPSCQAVDDPIRGGCSDYAEDGFKALLEHRIAAALFWVMLLGIPAMVGILDSDRRK